MRVTPTILPAQSRGGFTFKSEIKASRFGLVGWIMWRFQLARQRRDLAKLSDDLLRDIGMTREDALREARRSVWDVPHTWREDVRNSFSRSL